MQIDTDTDDDLDEVDRKLIEEGHFTREELARVQGRPVEEVAPERPSQPTLSTVEAELQQIEKRMREDRRGYFKDEAAQARYRDLLSMREQMKSGAPETKTSEADAEVDGSGLDPSLLEEWEAAGGIDLHLRIAQSTAQAALDSLEECDRDQLLDGFDGLPASAQTEVFRFLAINGGSFPPADEAALEEFGQTEEGQELLQAWGRQSPRMVGIVKGRMSLMLKSVPDTERQKLIEWFDGLPSRQAKAVLSALASR